LFINYKPGRPRTLLSTAEVETVDFSSEKAETEAL
jgi:hypothetical protein